MVPESGVLKHSVVISEHGSTDYAKEAHGEAQRRLVAARYVARKDACGRNLPVRHASINARRYVMAHVCDVKGALCLTLRES